MTDGEHSVVVRGRQVHVWQQGVGTPLLVLHDPWTYRWLPIYDRLAADFEVVLPIHPGFAGSGGFEDLDDMQDVVFHYLDLLDVLELERPILMGASLGGWIAAELAIRYAAAFRALVLVDALGLRVPGASTTDLFRLDPAQLRAAVFADPSSASARELIPDVPAQEELEAVLKARQVLARFAWQFPDNAKLAHYLYRIICPTLILWGERDGLVPLRHGELYHSQIPRAALKILPACGHLPHVEQPEVAARMILEFLAPEPR